MKKLVFVVLGLLALGLTMLGTGGISVTNGRVFVPGRATVQGDVRIRAFVDSRFSGPMMPLLGSYTRSADLPLPVSIMTGVTPPARATLRVDSATIRYADGETRTFEPGMSWELAPSFMGPTPILVERDADFELTVRGSVRDAGGVVTPFVLRVPFTHERILRCSTFWEHVAGC